MDYEERKSVINKNNDGNHINQSPEEYRDYGERLMRVCGFCGDPQEDNEAMACNHCLNDEYIKEYLNGR